MRVKAFETIQLIWRGFVLVWHSSKSLTFLAMLLAAIVAFEPIAALWITKQIIDMLTRFASGNAGLGRWLTLGTPDLVMLSTLLAAQAALWVGSKAISSIQQLVQRRAQYKFEVSVMGKIMRKCETLDLAFFESPASVDRLEKSMRGSLLSAWNVLWMTFSIFHSLVVAATLMFALVMLNILAPIVVLICTLPQMFSSATFARQRWQLWKDTSTESRLRYYFPWVVCDKDYAPEIKFFAVTKYFRQQHEHFFKIADQKENKIAWLSELFDFIWATVSSIGAIAVYVYICVLAFVRLISTGDAVFYMGAVDRVQSSLMNLFEQGGAVYEQSLYLSDLFEFLDQPPESVPGALKRFTNVDIAPSRLQRGLEFRNVSFTYPGAERAVLQNVSFSLSPHESVAVVGKNGAGKSTLVKLLLRLYDPTEGQILLDGKDLRHYDLNSYREICSAIFQDFSQYSLTMRENIGFGDVERLHDTAQIEWAARRSGAMPIVERMPKGLEGYLTKNYAEDGEELSGGEWQKVALARALMREAQIMILDEPTAALDAFAEYEMFKLFGELTESKLSILISHRFSTVRIAQTILVLDEGKLVEQGPHEKLMAANALYASMYSKQADRYK